MHAGRAPAEALLPSGPIGRKRAVALALLAHAALIAALTWGVSWQRQDIGSPVQAELWASVPREAAPRAVEPPPPPPPRAEAPRPTPPPRAAEPPRDTQREAEIARDRERQKAERERAEREREREKAQRERREKEQQVKLDKERQEQRERREQAEKAKRAEQKAEQKAEQVAAEDARRAEALRQENLRRMAGLADATGGPAASGTAAQSAGPSASYAGRIVARIRPNIVFTDEPRGNPVAEVEVRADASGNILGRRLLKASGQPSWDEAVLKAIDKTEVLPRDTDGRVPPLLVLSFRPRN